MILCATVRRHQLLNGTPVFLLVQAKAFFRDAIDSMYASLNSRGGD